MKCNCIFFFLCAIFFNNSQLSAQEFYTYLGSSESSLTQKLGRPDSKKMVGDTYAYQYIHSDREKVVFSVKHERIIWAIKSIRDYSQSKAQNTSSVQILLYMANGFTKQGKEEGMTILKKGKRILTIGWMPNNDGSYSTIISAM